MNDEMSERSSFFAVIFIGVLAVVFSILFAMALSFFFAEGDTDSGIVTALEPSAIEPDEVLALPSQEEPFEWTPLLIGLVVLAGAGVVGAGGRMSYSAVKSSKIARRERAREIREKETQWEGLIERYKGTVNRLAEYETDIGLAIDFPAMHDVSIEPTSAMLKTMRIASDLDRSLDKDEDICGSDELLREYRDAVVDFETAFDIAKRNAERIQWNNVSESEQKDLKQAKLLLSHASDPANPQELRLTYMSRLRDLIGRINDRHRAQLIPTVTINLIEEQTRLLLTDGNDDDMVSTGDDVVNIIAPENETVFRM